MSGITVGDFKLGVGLISIVIIGMGGLVLVCLLDIQRAIEKLKEEKDANQNRP